MQRISPLVSTGLMRLEASITPPDAAPAPMTVWISSMNRIAPGSFFSSVITPLRRFSKSPRYLVPAIRAPMSSAKMVQSDSTSGTLPSTIRRASPSAIAVVQEHRVALLLAEDRDQHVAHADFLLAARLHVKDGALQHPLEAERRLHLALLALLEPRGRLVDVVLQLLFELDRVRAAGAQHFAHLRGVEDREQQVLDRQVLVTRLARLVERVVETVLELVGQHFRQTFQVERSG